MDSKSKLIPGIKIKKYKGKSVYCVNITVRNKQHRKDINSEKLPCLPQNHATACALKKTIDIHAKKGEIEEINKWLSSPISVKRDPNLVATALDDYMKQLQKSNKPVSTVNFIRKCNNKLLDGEYGLKGYTIEGLANDPNPIFELIESWSHLTLKTVNNYLGPLRKVFERAYIKRRITVNPFHNFSASSLIEGTNSSYQIDPYSIKELIKLIEEARKYFPPVYANFIQANSFTGLRFSEMFGQQCVDIDLANREFIVNRAIVEKNLKNTKTEGSQRTIELNDMAEEAYQSQLPDIFPNDAWLWINPNTNKPMIAYKEINKTLKTICKKAGIRYRPASQFRHSYATNRIMNGDNLYSIAEQMGHRNKNGQVSIEMLFKHYGTYIREADVKSTFGSKEKINAV